LVFDDAFSFVIPSATLFFISLNGYGCATIVDFFLFL